MRSRNERKGEKEHLTTLSNCNHAINYKTEKLLGGAGSAGRSNLAHTESGGICVVDSYS